MTAQLVQWLPAAMTVPGTDEADQSNVDRYLLR